MITRLLFLFLAIPALAAGVNENKTITLGWDYNPEARELGGMSVADYMTNITFRIYSSTNCQIPLTNWTITATVAGTNRIAVVPIGDETRFFYCTTYNGRLESNPSNVAQWLARPSSGTLSVLWDR